MNILVVGYGFYALGDHNLEGGTVIRSIISWLHERPNHTLNMDILVRSEEAQKRATKRLATFSEKILVAIPNHLRSRIELSVVQNGSHRDSYDAAVIAVPENSHLEVINYVSKHAKNVLIVKPVGLNASQNLEIQKLCADNNCELFIDFHKRFDEANIAFVNTISNSSCDEGTFRFSYGQKSEMPKVYFSKWARSSNPFQYLAPHYLDIIGIILDRKGYSDSPNIQLDGYVHSTTFKDLNVVSSVNAFIEISFANQKFNIAADCNWMEPDSMPFGSRQRIEYLDESVHYISEQDDRGQKVFADKISVPNPHFMTSKEFPLIDGYGKRSYSNFLDYCNGIYPKDKLCSAVQYGFTSQILDFVNRHLKNED